MGLWIDHRKAVIVTVLGKGEETSVIESQAEKQPGRFDGVRSTTPYESQSNDRVKLPQLKKLLLTNFYHKR